MERADCRVGAAVNATRQLTTTNAGRSHAKACTKASPCFADVYFAARHSHTPIQNRIASIVIAQFISLSVDHSEDHKCSEPHSSFQRRCCKSGPLASAPLTQNECCREKC